MKENNKYKRVMVVDDNDIDRYIAQRIIGDTHFSDEVLIFGSAYEALSFLKENEHNPAALPEIIFVDIYMPEMSGFDFMDAYSEFPATVREHCSVYIMSSTIDPNDIERANNDPNVISFNVKPIDPVFLREL